jgi:hypothetical protein
MKIKINGVCVNNCSFCLFHNDPRRLEVEDLDYFFDMINKPRFCSLEINGGEPTIHPHFREICALLRERFKGRVTLTLGTNLIPMSWSRGRFPKIYRTVLETYDHIAVGCDDEHKNIHILERMAPDIMSAGLGLHVTVVAPFCSDATRHRILALRAHGDIRVAFSEVHHFHESRPVVNDVSTPCRRRVQQFLLNCNGDGFFCWHQEMETPLFNLYTVGREELNYYLDDYDPQHYRFCSSCPNYKPDGAGQKLLRSRVLPIRLV